MRRSARGTAMLACANALLLATTLAAAQPSGDRSVDDYRNATRRALHGCSHSVADPTSFSPARDGDALAHCAAAAKTGVADKFDAAMTSTMDPAVRAALQRHQAAFFAALNGVTPLPGEASTAYRQRQAGLRCAFSHAWTQVEQSEAEDRFKGAKGRH